MFPKKFKGFSLPTPFNPVTGEYEPLLQKVSPLHRPGLAQATIASSATGEIKETLADGTERGDAFDAVNLGSEVVLNDKVVFGGDRQGNRFFIPAEADSGGDNCTGDGACYSVGWECYHCDQEIVGSCSDNCTEGGGWQQYSTGTMHFSLAAECISPPSNPVNPPSHIWSGHDNDCGSYKIHIFTDEIYKWEVDTPYGVFFDTDPGEYRTMNCQWDDEGTYKLAKIVFGGLSGYVGECPAGTCPDCCEEC